MTTEHKYAHVLRWIADGLGDRILMRVRYQGVYHHCLQDMNECGAARLLKGELVEDWEFKLREAVVLVNGIWVPAPESVAPKTGEAVFIADPFAEALNYRIVWSGSAGDFRALQRDILYKSSEHAIARAKAMLVMQQEAPK